jgi:hypothetical protein
MTRTGEHDKRCEGVSDRHMLCSFSKDAISLLCADLVYTDFSCPWFNAYCLLADTVGRKEWAWGMVGVAEEKWEGEGVFFLRFVLFHPLQLFFGTQPSHNSRSSCTLLSEIVIYVSGIHVYFTLLINMAETPSKFLACKQCRYIFSPLNFNQNRCLLVELQFNSCWSVYVPW